MVATGDQRRACRRAERGGMELSVTQACLGDAIQSGSRDDAAECTRNTVALGIGHDEEDVRRAFGRYDPRWPKRLGVRSAFLDHTSELFGRCRNLFAIDRYRGTGGTRCAGELLSPGGRQDCYNRNCDYRAQEEISVWFHKRIVLMRSKRILCRFSDMPSHSAIGPRSYEEARLFCAVLKLAGLAADRRRCAVPSPSQSRAPVRASCSR